MNRKTFLRSTSVLSAGFFLDPFSNPLQAGPVETGFQLKILATNWGFPGTLEEYGAKARAAGYDGIEIWWSLDPVRQQEIFNVLNKHGLEVGFLCAGSQTNPQEHLAYFKKMVEGAAYNKTLRPLYINCHSGRDFFSFEENKAFIDLTTATSRETGIRILHETHRSRMLFAAPVASMSHTGAMSAKACSPTSLKRWPSLWKEQIIFMLVSAIPKVRR
jgi:hypothetical protein